MSIKITSDNFKRVTTPIIVALIALLGTIALVQPELAFAAESTQGEVNESGGWQQVTLTDFAPGEFFQTELVSNAIRLQPNGVRSQSSTPQFFYEYDEYYTNGTYTSSVFDAGQLVDWTHLEWDFQKEFYLDDRGDVTLEVRAGNGDAANPEWSEWIELDTAAGTAISGTPIPRRLDDNRITFDAPGTMSAHWIPSNLGDVPNSQFLQYRFTFVTYSNETTMLVDNLSIQYLPQDVQSSKQPTNMIFLPITLN